MATKMDREGEFRGRIVGYGLTKSSKSDSKAKFIDVRCAADEIWNGEEWVDWREYSMEAWGSLCIVKKDGTLSNFQVEALLKHAGWDGDFNAIIDGSWQPAPIAFSTKVNRYEKDGQKLENFQVAFINNYESTPGGGVQSTVDTNEAKALQAQFGGTMRALAGNAKRNAPKPPGRPATPPAPVSASVTGNADDSIPF